MNKCTRRLSAVIFFSSILFSHALSAAPAQISRDGAIIVWESSNSLRTTVDNLKVAMEGKNFRLIREQSLDQGFVKAGQENQQQHIVYFCNFNFLNRAMALESRVGLFLPFRITVVRDHDGRVLVYAVDPKKLSRLFKNTKLDHFSKQLSSAYREIIEEAIL